MPLDPTFLRQHYASLSDEALLELNRDDLVEVARQILDEELAKRKADKPARSSSAGSRAAHPLDEEADAEYTDSDEEGHPLWLEDSSEVYARHVQTGQAPAPEAAHARDVLEAANIPCMMELFEEPGEVTADMRFRWRILVPGKLSQRATSVLDRDIFNDEFEAAWQTHLEVLSDDELRRMEPEYAFCGLYDRIERINRVYDEELERRRMKP